MGIVPNDDSWNCSAVTVFNIDWGVRELLVRIVVAPKIVDPVAPPAVWRLQNEAVTPCVIDDFFNLCAVLAHEDGPSVHQVVCIDKS